MKVKRWLGRWPIAIAEGVVMSILRNEAIGQDLCGFLGTGGSAGVLSNFGRTPRI
jgi:hypothetical protein